jgi:hypothetical protein
MTNCGLLDISSSSNENVGPNAISIDPIINVGLVIVFFTTFYIRWYLFLGSDFYIIIISSVSLSAALDCLTNENVMTVRFGGWL